MNKVYRIVWNKARGAWTVVSELATGHSKSGGRRRARIVPTVRGLAKAAGFAATAYGLLAIANSASAQVLIADSNATIVLETFAPGQSVFEVPVSSTINAAGDGIRGNVSQNWQLTNRGSVTGTTGGIRLGSATANAAVVNNFGSLTNTGTGGGGAHAGVLLNSGGTLTNHAGAQIHSNSDGVYAGLAGTTVINNGAIQTNLTGLYFLNGGTFSQGATGSITHNGGTNYGVIGHGTGNMVGTNAGSITATNIGVWYRGGAGTLTNTGTITGGTSGILFSTAGHTLANRGTVTGTSGTAINVSGNNNAIILGTGSVLNGNAVSTGSGNTLRLDGSGGEDSNLSGFSTLTMAGIDWTLGGTVDTSAGAADATAVRNGKLTLTGALTNANGGGATIDAGATLQLGNGGTTGSITGNVVSNGTLAFNRSDAVIFGAAISGAGGVSHDGVGTTTFTGDSSYAGETAVNAGELVVAGQISTGTVDVAGIAGQTGTLTVSGQDAYLHVIGGVSTPSYIGWRGTGTLNIEDGGRMQLDTGAFNVGFAPGGLATLNVSGGGSLNMLSTGIWHLGFAGTAVLNITDGGRVDTAGAARFGQVNGTASVTVSGPDSRWAIGGILDPRLGSLSVLDRGMVTANSVIVAGFANNNAQVLVSGASSRLESATTFTVGSNATATGVLTLADGGVAKVGGGTLQLGAGNATLNIGGVAGGAATGAGALEATTVTTGNNGRVNFNHTDGDYLFGLAIGGTGAINQVAGNTNLTGASAGFNGTTNITGGTLRVNGTLGSATSAVSVSNGGTLGGAGVIGGNVTINDGTVAAGNSPGTLTINGDFNLNAASVLDFELGEAGVAGGTLNDLINVGGDLVLDGTLNVSQSAGGTYGVGVYRLINYTGNLTDNGLELGFMPAGNTQFLQTSIANQVNLVNTSGLTLNYWDGDAGVRRDGAITGGNGIWRASGDEKWTDANGSVNAPYANGAFAIFTGTGGTVTADDSAGAITVSGMQFTVDGYRLQGDAVELGAGTNTLRVGDGSAAGSGYVATIDSVLAGSGRLDKTDLGTLILTAANTYTGGTAISGGTLQIGAGGTTGSINGDVLNNATLAFNRSGSVTFGNAISGSGAVNQIGSGTTILTGANSYTGGTTISAGTLQIGDGGTTGSIEGDVVNNGTLSFYRSDALTFGGVISGNGFIAQRGPGTTILTGNSDSFIGATSVVMNSTLQVDGALGAASWTSVQPGATLTGSGTLGAVTVAGHLAPGSNGVGRLTTGRLYLGVSAQLDVELGARQVVGGALNDLLVVNGDLRLNGTLNITEAPGGSFDIGVYRIINYTGALTDDVLDIGALPNGIAPNDLFVQTAVANQVNLINTGGLTFRFWDGPDGHDNGLFDGGAGRWLASGNSNWTAMDPTANAPWTDAAFSVFQGAAGEVVVDNADGAVNFAGMQFLVGGYSLSGGTLTTDRADTLIRVGDGTAAGEAMTATISATITGAGALRKTDVGTLILDGDNSYAGGTTVSAGVLQVARDANLGATSGALAFDGGTLRTGGDFSSARAINLLAGGGAIDTQEHAVSLTGKLSGAGDWTKQGSGTLLLRGANSTTGTATVADGILRAGSAGALGSASYAVEAGALLDLNGFGHTVDALSNAGTVSLLGTTLTVTGGYTGNSGVLQMGTVLGSDGTASDRLILDGGAASGRTLIELTNLGGLGAQTAGDGIELVSAVNGAITTAQTTRDAFGLAGGFVEAGAFEYRLHAGDANGAGENWYLRSTLADDGSSTGAPGATTYRSEVPLYAAAPALLAQSDLTMVGTLHGREGDVVNGASAEANGHGYRVWARGITRNLDSRQQGAVSPRNDARAHGTQVGVDLLQGSNHRLGLYAGQLDWDSDVEGFAGGVEGNRVGRLSGRSNYLGAYWTYTASAGWYGDVVLQQGWHDGDAKLGQEADVEGDSTLLSVEVGKPFALSEHWQLEPQAQVILNHQRLDAQNIPAARIDYDDELATTLRLGARLAGDYALERDRIQPYARLNLWHGVNGTDTLEVAGPAASTDIDSARGYSSLEAAVGATWVWNEHFALYGEAGRWIALDDSRGQELKGSHSLSVGLRVNW